MIPKKNNFVSERFPYHEKADYLSRKYWNYLNISHSNSIRMWSGLSWNAVRIFIDLRQRWQMKAEQQVDWDVPLIMSRQKN